MENRPITAKTLILALAGAVLPVLAFGSIALAQAEKPLSSWDKVIGQPVGIAPPASPNWASRLANPGFERYDFSITDLVSIPDGARHRYSYGVFELQDGGKVCVNLRDTPGHCTFFLKSRGVMFMLTKRTHRFPVSVDFELN